MIEKELMIGTYPLRDCRVYFKDGYVRILTADKKLLWETKAEDLNTEHGVSLGIIYECMRCKALLINTTQCWR